MSSVGLNLGKEGFLHDTIPKGTMKLILIRTYMRHST